jgi:hypothetical protein
MTLLSAEKDVSTNQSYQFIKTIIEERFNTLNIYFQICDDLKPL